MYLSEGQHTPIHYVKDDVRRDWLKLIPRDSDVFTISHAALGILNTLEWRGRVQVCDIDPVVIAAAREMVKHQSRLSHQLDILPPVQGDVRRILPLYAWKVGLGNTGCVDLDLAGFLGCPQRHTHKQELVWDIIAPVLDCLAAHRYQGLTVVTFKNGRDCFGNKGNDWRLSWLSDRLPRGMRLLGCRWYRSGRLDEKCAPSIGSSMGIAYLGMGRASCKFVPSHQGFQKFQQQRKPATHSRAA